MISTVLTIRTKNPIRCPICGRDIGPCAFVMIDRLMFCPDCAHNSTPNALGLEIDAATFSLNDVLYTTSHGCWFYSPPPDTTRDLTSAQIAANDESFPDVFPHDALRYAAQRHTPDGRPPVAPTTPRLTTPRRCTPTHKPKRQPTLFHANP